MTSQEQEPTYLVFKRFQDAVAAADTSSTIHVGGPEDSCHIQITERIEIDLGGDVARQAIIELMEVSVRIARVVQAIEAVV